MIEFIIKIIEALKISYKYYIFCLIIYIFYRLSIYYYPKLKGYMGEKWVNEELNKLPKNEYKVLKNITIKDEKGTHQIDHIVVSIYGIFVIETKNYFGTIRGNEYREHWTQYYNRKQNQFINPIRQNYSHIKALENLLKIEENNFISIICFSNLAKLKVTSKVPIVQLYKIKETVSLYNKPLLNNIDQIEKIILDNNIKNQNKEHINEIKEKIKEKEEKINNNICPKCGSELITKKGKYGIFIGCTSYPKCKFTINNKQNN